MAIYRVQVVHASYWRGQPHRWNNTFHYLAGSGTPDFATIVASIHTTLNGLGAVGYAGGIAEIKVYASTGGTPVYSSTYFNWDVPASWLPYVGTLWGTVTGGGVKTGEAAALFSTAVGLSRTGKPVSLRTYWHAFVSGATDMAAPDFATGVQTAAVTQYNKLQSVPGTSGPAFVLVSPSGGPVASTATLDPYIVAHQRVRGRRRAPLVTASGRYTGPTVKVPPSILAD